VHLLEHHERTVARRLLLKFRRFPPMPEANLIGRNDPPMSLIWSQPLAELARAAAAGDQARVAQLSARHPRAAQALAPLLAAMSATPPPAAVALQTLEQQGLVLSSAQQLSREQAAMHQSAQDSRNDVGRLTDGSAGISTSLQQIATGLD
jgi:methyl-accepting chemotaxis protein